MSYFYICVFLSLALACEYKGKTYKDGEEWIDGQVFKVRCIIESDGQWRLGVIECVSPDGIVVPMCDERRVNGRIYQCKRLVNGSADFQNRDDTETPCDGHPYGSLWKEGSLQYACGKGGVKDLMGCVASSDMFIPSGETKLVDGVMIECKRYANGTARMHTLRRSNRRTCIGYMGERVNEGSEWDTQLRRYRCGKGGVAVLLGCVTPAGELLPLGAVRRIDGLNMTCEKKEGGGVSARVLRK